MFQVFENVGEGRCPENLSYTLAAADHPYCNASISGDPMNAAK